EFLPLFLGVPCALCSKTVGPPRLGEPWGWGGSAFICGKLFCFSPCLRASVVGFCLWVAALHLSMLHRHGSDYFFEAEIELTVIVSPFSVPLTVAFSPAYLSIADLSPFNL